MSDQDDVTRQRPQAGLRSRRVRHDSIHGIARAAIKRQMEEWRGEVDTIKCNLIEIGSRPDSLEYNLAATEALRLALCINDLASLLLEDAG